MTRSRLAAVSLALTLAATRGSSPSLSAAPANLDPLIIAPACDGSTDFTSTIQAAITQASNNGVQLVVNSSGNDACLVGMLEVPSNSHITVNVVLRLKANTFSSEYSLFHAGPWLANVTIDGSGTLDGNRPNQTAQAGGWSAGVSTLLTDNVTVSGLTIRSFQAFPVNIVAANTASMLNLIMSDSGAPVEFAGGTNNCLADGLRIFNIDETGFSFYGGVHDCTLRNSVISGTWYGATVQNDWAQNGVSYNIQIQNVESFNNATPCQGGTCGAGFAVITDNTPPPPNAPAWVQQPPYVSNHDIHIVSSHAHANPVAWLPINTGANVTTDIDTTAGVALSFPNAVCRLSQYCEEPAPHMNIDVPANNGVVSAQGFNIGLWAIDIAAMSGCGVDTVHMYAYPAGGGPPIWLGAASPSAYRPDVAAAYHISNVQYGYSGFNLGVTLPPGQYFLWVAAHSTVTNTFNQSAGAWITVQ
jgi:hypothetical protein